MMDAAKLQSSLEQFRGLDTLYRHPGFNWLTYTDGVQFMAEHAEAYWLLDIIASYLPVIPADEYMVFAELNVHRMPDRTFGIFVIHDGNRGNGKLYYTPVQTIEYTDFPLDSMKIYASRCEEVTGERWRLMLPGEY